MVCRQIQNIWIYGKYVLTVTLASGAYINCDCHIGITNDHNNGNGSGNNNKAYNNNNDNDINNNNDDGNSSMLKSNNNNALRHFCNMINRKPNNIYTSNGNDTNSDNRSILICTNNWP